MRAVIDTNVLLSGLLWHGAPHELLAHVRAAALGLVSSPALLAELEVVIGRAKFDAILTRSNTSRERALAEVRQLAEVIEPPPLAVPVCRDPDDDAGGKDGVIRHVMSTVNPQGCRVTCFKKPTAEEAGHDFLWRIHPAAPARGEIAIFNRSHYEDVLVARVHRRDADYEERRYWDDYQAAFEDALSECSTTHVPWFVIPANHKGFRDLAVSQIIVETLESLKMELPEPTVNIPQIRRQYHAAAEEQKTGDASAAVPGTTAIDRP